MSPPDLETIAEARADAITALARATGSDSLCTLGRERLPAAKYHEGAAAALGDAYRAARADRALPTADDWGAAFVARAAASVPWRAYLVGGRDALARLTGAPPARGVDLTA